MNALTQPLTHLVLRAEAQAHALAERLRDWAEQAKTGRPYEVMVGLWRPIRSNPQNRLLHKLCSFFSAQAAWAGQSWDTEGWKRIFLAGAYGQDVDRNPFWPGELVAMNRKRSSELKRHGEDQMPDFIEQILALSREWNIDIEGVGEDELATPKGPGIYVPPGAEVGPRSEHFRSRKLLDAAKDAPACMGCGKVNEGDVVMAHANWAEYGKGAGIKAHDCFTCCLCHSCHRDLDAGSTMSKDEKKEFWRQAHIKTLVWLFQSGKVFVR